jgi:hypothetical protein
LTDAVGQQSLADPGGLEKQPAEQNPQKLTSFPRVASTAKALNRLSSLKLNVRSWENKKYTNERTN